MTDFHKIAAPPPPVGYLAVTGSADSATGEGGGHGAASASRAGGGWRGDTNPTKGVK